MQNPTFKHWLHWHDKAFTLSWDMPRVWAVLVYFKNGQQRYFWFKRTERPYRFKRWFLRKGKDQFKNIANINSPAITLYIFRGFRFWPQKITLPMRVDALRVREPEAHILTKEPKIKMRTFKATIPKIIPEATNFERVIIPKMSLNFKNVNQAIHPSLETDFKHYKNSQPL
ncbi:MAG: hypothetical protein ACK5CY_05940 [Bacteroidia bacterium]|jgi:hypothetical protein